MGLLQVIKAHLTGKRSLTEGEVAYVLTGVVLENASLFQKEFIEAVVLHGYEELSQEVLNTIALHSIVFEIVALATAIERVYPDLMARQIENVLANTVLYLVGQGRDLEGKELEEFVQCNMHIVLVHHNTYHPAILDFMTSRKSEEAVAKMPKLTREILQQLLKGTGIPAQIALKKALEGVIVAHIGTALEVVKRVKNEQVLV